MAFHDFWTNVRMAARRYAPRFIADAARLDAEAVEHMLRDETHWLTAATVAGFDETELSFLPGAERARLAELVTGFGREVSAVRATAPAPGETKERALTLLRDIVQLLEFDRYGDAEAFRLGKLFEREIEPRKPAELAELRFNTGPDHTGDPGLWIWAFLNEEASSSDEAFLDAARRLRAPLSSVARRVAPDRFPYLSFRDITEPAEAVEAP
jgi:hypothetical protein